MRRAIGIAMVIAIAVVFLNDIGRWVNSQSQLNESTAHLADWAAANVHSASRDVGAGRVTAEGARLGMRIYQYDQDQNTVRILSLIHI